MRKVSCIKKIKVTLLMFCLVVSSVMYVDVQAEEMTSRNIEEFYKEKFAELFPEYVEKMESCDEQIEQNAAYSENITYSLTNSARIAEERTIVETITRYEGDDMYELTFYSDGGFSEVALLSEIVSIEFEKGSSDTLRYINCTVYATLNDPGLIPYSGGIWGDGITYFKDGNFSASGYGNYIHMNLLDEDAQDPYILSKTSSQVKVIGEVYAEVLSGKYEQEFTKDTLLTITLNAGKDPTITYGYY